MATAALAIVSVVATAVGAGVQYSAQRRAAKAQEAAAEYNAKVARNQAQHEADISAENARRMTVQKRRRLASIRAQKAGSGISFTGSAVDQLTESAFTLERDIQDSVYSSQIRQRNLNQQADIALFEGRSQAAATRTNANASLLTGVGDVASQVYGGVQTGAFKIR